jgi:hypothetical protein
MEYILPSEYVINKFYQYVNRPTYKQSKQIYQGGCPICHEDSSWGKKFRCAYIVQANVINCFNCMKTWSPIQWIAEASGMSYEEILEEAKDYDFSINELLLSNEPIVKKVNPYTLPYDCINLLSPSQLKFHEDNKIVRKCLNEIKRRRLDTAINKPRTFYLSLTDNIHKNRLVIPFIDKTGKIVFYQSRALYKKDENVAKYLSKMNADKTIFGLQNINPNFEYLFKFEGPIDAMFVKNGIAIGGLDESSIQKQQLAAYFLFKNIWVLDNTFIDKSAKNKAKILIEKGEKIFIFPPKLRKFKDLNDICVAASVDKISPKFIIKNSYSGMEALMRLEK